jgi:hypothetical protein
MFRIDQYLEENDCKGSAFFSPTKIRKQIYQFLGSNKEYLL